MVKHKTIVILLILLLLTLILVFITIKLPRWTTYNNISGSPLYDGKFAHLTIFPPPLGGISILPPNYIPKTKTISLSIIDPKTKQTSELPLFKDISEMRTVKVLADTSKPLLWAVAEPRQDCSWPKSKLPLSECKTEFYKIDTTTGQKSLISEFEFKPNRYIIPLVQDFKNGAIWLLSNHNLSGLNTNQSNAYIAQEEVIRFDPGTQKFTSYKTAIYPQTDKNDWSIFTSGFPGSKKIADTDTDGNLFFLTETASGSSQLAKIDVNQNKIIPIPLPQTIGNGEFVIDKSKQMLYLTNYSWDGNGPSYLFQYDIKTNQFKNFGTLPIHDRDDVRGLLFNQGKLYAGFFKGLGIFNPLTKTWKIITQKDGLYENPVKNIYQLNKQLCVDHESTAISCQ